MDTKRKYFEMIYFVLHNLLINSERKLAHWSYVALFC